MKVLSILGLLILSSVLIFAQNNPLPNNGLSHSLSNQEKNLLKNYDRSFHETSPPVGDVRNIAEWESMESVIIAYNYGFGIPYSLIDSLADFVNVTILVSDASEQTSVTNLLINNGIDTSNCSFLIQDVDSWWSRDFSPWFIAVDNQTVSVVDFPYNRPRPNDDAVPSAIATSLNIPYYGMNVIQTGGNYMTDGYGRSACTDLVSDENNITDAQIRQKMQDYLGITTYDILPDPLDDYIKHIDCWGKYLAVDKVIITQVPESDYRYADYEAAAAFFENTNCSFGYPYKVYRTQSAAYGDNDENPYTNSLIINGKVFVPQTGSQWDDEAIAVYQQAMPGYQIIGVTTNGSPWINTDALHCRTHGIADRNMLFVKHFPLHDTISTTAGYEISADIYSYAGNDLKSGYPKLFYSVNDGDYQELTMTLSTKSNYKATIPVLSDTNKVSYYIVAQDTVGKTAQVPTMGQVDPYIFYTNNTTTKVNTVKQQSIKVYPNPNSGRFYLWVDLEQNQDVNVQILSISGKIVFNDVKNVKSNGQLVDIDASYLQSGVYMIKVVSKTNNFTSKLIVK